MRGQASPPPLPRFGRRGRRRPDDRDLGRAGPGRGHRSIAIPTARGAERPTLEWLERLRADQRDPAGSTLPAGESEIRFEGVAGGIVPQSAIVTGLPDGIVERNRDAYLLSPESLLDRSLGRRVHLRRTSLATGAVRRAGGGDPQRRRRRRRAADRRGLSRRCAAPASAEALSYDGVPQGLSARPTLSVRTRASAAGHRHGHPLLSRRPASTGRPIMSPRSRPTAPMSTCSPG